MVFVLAAAIVLSAALAAWKAEIEEKNMEVVVAELRRPAPGAPFAAPADTPRLEFLSAYLGLEDFQRQFALMRATTVTQRLAGGQLAFILLNGERRREWEQHEEALLAHEFGHAWIKAQGYPTPVFVPGPHACLAVHTGDIVQHVLIRAELQRRGIEYRRHWLESLEAAIPVLETAERPPEDDRCARARQAAEWVDVRLGLAPEWPLQDRYEKAVRRYLPEIVSTVEEITAYMKTVDVADRGAHRRALEKVFRLLSDLVYYRAKEYRGYGNLKKKRAAC